MPNFKHYFSPYLKAKMDEITLAAVTDGRYRAGAI
jgi:hypothetical protein